jgi:hypothetical protein
LESLPFGALESRRTVVRWNDGSASEAIRWCSGKALVCEGDLIGKTS